MKNSTIIDWVHNNIECNIYDYCKDLNRKSTVKYYLTYSLSEKNREKCKEILKEKKGNVAAVFNLKKKGNFPRTFLGGFKVLNGDLDDLRFLDDSPGYIIGLSSKGDSKRDKTGFTIFAGDRDIDHPNDNKLLIDPDVESTPRKVKFDSYKSRLKFDKKTIERKLNEYLRKDRPLLSSPYSNQKLDKGTSLGYLTWGLSLAPAKENGFMNFCPHASEGCLNSCLYTSGNLINYQNKINVRLLRSWLFVFRRDIFFDKLKKELLKGYKYSKNKNMKMALRLNVFSDLAWESIPIGI